MTGPDPALAAETKGFLDVEEGRRLYQAARWAAQRGPCLEIGSYCGKSTLYLGTGCREAGGTLYAVDHHRGSEEQQPGQEYCDPDLIGPDGRMDTFPWLRRTLQWAGLLDTVVPIVAPSELAGRAWATPLSLVFIDGGHTEEAAFTDYRVWAPHLIPGGLLLIHDLFPDPREGGQAPWRLYQTALASGLYSPLPTIKTLGVLERKS
jgi:predicted O-methyltransferase YrrM